MKNFIENGIQVTNLSLIIAMSMVPQNNMSPAPDKPRKSSPKLSQIPSRADQKQMEKVRNQDLFSKSRELINDLVFDPWDTKKALALRETLGALNEVPDLIDDKDTAIGVVMDRVERLAGINRMLKRAAQRGAETDALSDRLSKGHEGLIHLIESCFKI